MFAEVLRAEPPYTFGDDEDLYRRLFELGFANMEYSKDMVFPEDAIFIDRALGGHFGNLSTVARDGPVAGVGFSVRRRRESVRPCPFPSPHPHSWRCKRPTLDASGAGELRAYRHGYGWGHGIGGIERPVSATSSGKRARS